MTSQYNLEDPDKLSWLQRRDIHASHSALIHLSARCFILMEQIHVIVASFKYHTVHLTILLKLEHIYFVFLQIQSHHSRWPIMLRMSGSHSIDSDLSHMCPRKAWPSLDKRIQLCRI